MQPRTLDPDLSATPTDRPTGSDRWMLPLYWLAGARWESLRECHATERERVAVIGSTASAGFVAYNAFRHCRAWAET